MNIAGIVTYNPDIERLLLNLDAIYRQVDRIVIADNGSSNFDEMKKKIEHFKNIYIIALGENKGIAFALNVLCDYAYNNKYEWILTLDQDSVVETDIISKYDKYKGYSNQLAMMTCIIKDRNFKLEIEKEYIKEKKCVEIDSCITSGSFVNLNVWKKVNGFNSKLFIDAVDTDFSFKLIENGYKIIRIPYIGMLHEVGNRTRVVRVFSKEVVIYNYSAFRTYYIIRNQVYISKKYINLLGKKESRKTYWASYRRIAIQFIFEKDKFVKLKASIKGLLDGHKLK